MDSTPSHPSLLWEAVTLENLPLVEKLLELEIPEADFYDDDGENILYTISYQNNLPLLKLVLSKGPKQLIHEFGQSSQTPLTLAASLGHLDLVLCLLEAGSDPNAQNAEDLGYIALCEATRFEHLEVVHHLLQAGAHPNQVDYLGDTALHIAVEKKNIALIDLLLEHGSQDFINQFGDFGDTPLIRAAKDGSTEVVRHLLHRHANPNAQDLADWIGTTAIIEAVEGGHVELVELLLQAGVDPTQSGWMNISAVNKAWNNIKGDQQSICAIRALLKPYQCKLRDGIYGKNSPK